MTSSMARVGQAFPADKPPGADMSWPRAFLDDYLTLPARFCH
jgi:hypothetical protein